MNHDFKSKLIPKLPSPVRGGCATCFCWWNYQQFPYHLPIIKETDCYLLLVRKGGVDGGDPRLPLEGPLFPGLCLTLEEAGSVQGAAELFHALTANSLLERGTHSHTLIHVVLLCGAVSVALKPFCRYLQIATSKEMF